MPVCSGCGSTTSTKRKNNNREIWYKSKENPNELLCQKCQIAKIQKLIDPEVLSESHKGQIPWNKGMKGIEGHAHTEASIALIKQNRKGKNLGSIPWNKGKPGYKVKIKKDDPRIGKPSWNKGIPLSNAARKKLSDVNTGKTMSADVRAKISKTMKIKAPFKGRKLYPHVIEIKKQKRLLQVFPKKDSAPERALQEGLIKACISFKTHYPIIGQPDIFIEPNLTVFADGDHWHGNPAKYKPDDMLTGRIKASERWEKDRKITDELQSKGYIVLRFWESEIKANLLGCVQKIVAQVS